MTVIQQVLNDFRPVHSDAPEGVLVKRHDFHTFVRSFLATMEEQLGLCDEVQARVAVKNVDRAFVRISAEIGAAPGCSDKLPQGDELPSDDGVQPLESAWHADEVSHGIDVEEIPRGRIIEVLWPWFKRIEESFSTPGVKLTTEILVSPSAYGRDQVRLAFVEPHQISEPAPKPTPVDDPIEINVGGDGVTVRKEQLETLLERCLKLLKEDIEKGGRVEAVFEAEQLPDGQVKVGFRTGYDFRPVDAADPTITSEYQDQPQIQKTPVGDDLDPAAVASNPVPEESEVARYVNQVKFVLMHRYNLDRRVVEDLPVGWSLSEWAKRVTTGITPDRWAKTIFDQYGFSQTQIIDPTFCTFEEARLPNAIVSSDSVFTPIQRIRLKQLDGTRRGSILSQEEALLRGKQAASVIENYVRCGLIGEGDLHTVSIQVGKLKGHEYWVSIENHHRYSSKPSADKPVDPAAPTITSKQQEQPGSVDQLDPASIAPLHSAGVRPDSKDEARADAEAAEFNRTVQEVASEAVFLTSGPDGPETVTPLGYKKRMLMDGEVFIDTATNSFVDPRSVDSSKWKTAESEDTDAAEYEYLKQYLQNSQQLHHGMAPEVIDLVLATETPSFWLMKGAVISELEAAFKQVCDGLTRDMSDEERDQLNPARTEARNALLYFFKSPFDTSKFIAEAKEILRKEYGWPESLIDSKDWSHKRWAELQAEGHTAASVIQRYFPL